MKSVAIAVLALLPLFQASAEEKPAPPPETVKFIELKYLDSDRLNRVINLVQQLTLGKATIIADNILHTIALKGTSDGVATAEQLLKRFDTPAAETKARQIRITAYLVEAADSSAGLPAPTELASALQQLRATFGYDKLRLVDTTILQSRENAETYVNDMLSLDSDQKTILKTSYRAARYNESEKTVYLQLFMYQLKVPVKTAPNNFQYMDSGIQTDLAIKEGQKLVLGKLSAGDRPLFVILTAKVEP